MRRAAPVCSEEVVAVPPSTPGRLDSIRGFLRQTALRNARLAVSDSMPELANLQEIRQAMPRLYPRELRDAGLGGTALSFVVIDTAGVPTPSSLVKSTGHLRLDQSSDSIINLMRFYPAVLDGCRAPSAALIPVTWTVKGSLR